MHAREEVIELAQPANEPALPATVVTAHLAACAEALTTTAVPVADLASVAADLVAGQHDISTALDAIATRLARGAVTEERLALVAVLRAASAASEHAAEALSAGEQLFENIANESAF